MQGSLAAAAFGTNAASLLPGRRDIERSATRRQFKLDDPCVAGGTASRSTNVTRTPCDAWRQFVIQQGAPPTRSSECHVVKRHPDYRCKQTNARCLSFAARKHHGWLVCAIRTVAVGISSGVPLHAPMVARRVAVAVCGRARRRDETVQFSGHSKWRENALGAGRFLRDSSNMCAPTLQLHREQHDVLEQADREVWR